MAGPPYTTGDMFYADSPTTVAKLTAVPVGYAIISGGVATRPSYGKIDLNNFVTGILLPIHGGTGINNGTSTFTIGGNTSFTGSYTFNGNLTGNTNVTFPTSGTLATVDGTVTKIIGTENQVLANGTFGIDQNGTVTLTTPQDIGTSSSPQFTGLNLSGLTISEITGTDASKNLVSGSLTGDITSSGFVTSLAIVNSNVGTFGDASHSLTLTVNGKGLLTAISSNSIQISESQVTNLITDLAAKLDLSGGTMTGNLILNADATLALQAVTFQQLNSAVVGVYKLQGGYDPTVTSLYPVAADTTNPVSAIILQGMIWSVTVNGIVNGNAVTVGDQLLALIDSPGQTDANWSIINNTTNFLPSANIFVGNASNIATAVVMSGDVGIDNAGITTIQNLAVTNAKIANTTIDLTTKVTGILPNANTTATNSNTNSTIVARDGSGNFSAGTITAALTGNASTATALQTARTINGVSFDGTADITVTAAAGTLTGTTLNSSVVTSSLTAVGTIVTGTWSGLFGSVSGANLTNLTAANISAGTAGINISGNAATVTTNANLTGDVTSVGNATTLATVNSNVGTFGDGTHVSQVTVNAKGLITAVSNVLITGAAPTGSASGDLSGTYPGPTVAKINGVALGTTTATSGNILIASGTAWDTHAMSGDITMNSLGTTAVGSNKITFAKFQQVGANNLVGNATGSLANATGISLGSTLTFVSTALQTTAITGDVTASANSFATTVSAINGVSLGSTTATAGNILIGSGTQWVTNAMSGDITIGSTGVTAIGSNKVTLAQMAQIATASFLGRNTASTGNVEVLSTSTAKTMLNLSGTNSGDVTLAGQNYLSIAAQVITANAVDLSGTNATGILAAARFPALTGDVTTSSGAIATTVANNAISYAKFQQVAASSIVGNPTGSLANAQGITLGTSLTFSGTTINAIQGIRTADSPQFTGLTLSGLTTTGVVVTGTGGLISAVTAVSTYTPTIGDGTNNFTTSTATGTYYKIGHIYFVQIILVWSGKGSASAGAGIRISLPATMGSNQTRLNGTIGYANGISFTGSYLTCVGGPNTSYVNLYGISNAGTPNQVIVSNLGTTGEISMQFTMWDN